MTPAANAAYPQRMWLLLLGLAPFLFVGAVFGLLSDETQIWLGDLRVVLCRGFFVCLLVGFRFLWIAACTWPQCYVLHLAFTASTSVRTEPRAISAIPEEKKNKRQEG